MKLFEARTFQGCRSAGMSVAPVTIALSGTGMPEFARSLAVPLDRCFKCERQ